MSESSTPSFIKNSPCGKDKFTGKSQEKLANAIASYFLKSDELECKTNDNAVCLQQDMNCLPRIVGLEGQWGIGKSNVIKILKGELENKNYHFFEYDAWGHQEDLQRRSFLESLTSNLISETILTGDVKSSVCNDKISWKDRLNELLAKRKITVTKSIPQVSNGALLVALSLWLTPIFIFLTDLVGDKTSLNIVWLVLIALVPILTSLAIWGIIAYRSEEARHLSFFVRITKNNDEKLTNIETINEDEPTVAKFRNWMETISNSIENRTKLVIVFDNMDRLPSEKVKELWSSIHTFFAESSFKNIWVIIPFDENHLANAFNDGKSDTEQKNLTGYFIKKTFPIVYRVAPPIITDYKQVFEVLFNEAFGKEFDKNIRDIINRTFRIEYPNANVRDIISFINELVAIRSIWDAEIDLKFISIFVLKKSQILSDPIKQILTGEYLDKLKLIIPNDDELQKSISALVYSIDKSLAEQILMKKFIQNCILQVEGYEINRITSNENFLTILEEVITELDPALIDKAIHLIVLINGFNDIITVNNWNYLLNIKIKEPIFSTEISSAHKYLIEYSDQIHKQKFVNYLCHGIAVAEEFKGANYFSSLSDLESFLKDKDIKIKLNFRKIDKPSKTFIDFVIAARENYNKYGLSTNPEFLDLFFADNVPNGLGDKEALLYLKNDSTYSFKQTLKQIELTVENDNITDANFYDVLYIYKILSKSKPLKTSFNATNISQLLQTYSNQTDAEYPDLVAMSLAIGVDVALPDNTRTPDIANSIEFYSTYQNLIINNLSWRFSALSSVLAFMINNDMGEGIQLSIILRFYNQIKSTLDVDDEKFLTHLDRFCEPLKDELTIDKIQEIIPDVEFFKLTVSFNLSLSNIINSIAAKKIEALDQESLYLNGSPNLSYWFIALGYLIHSKDFQSLPSNLINLASAIIKDTASGDLPLPIHETLDSLVKKVDKKQIAGTILSITTDFCNGNYTMTPLKFLYLIPWLRAKGMLDTKRHEDVVTNILFPIIDDPDCLAEIIKDSSFYINIINNAREYSNELKRKLSTVLQTTNEESIISFGNEIGIQKEVIENAELSN